MILNAIYTTNFILTNKDNPTYELVKIGTKYCYLEDGYLLLRVKRSEFYSKLRLSNLNRKLNVS